MTELNIAALRLRNQRISETDFTHPEQAVDWLVAVQSQDYAAAKWAVGLRLTGVVEDAVEQAFNQGLILRTHVMRPTWHFVTPADIRWLLALTAARVQAANAGMYRRLGLEDHLKRANKILEKSLRDGQQLTREEVREALKGAGFSQDDNLQIGYFLMHAELDGIICSGKRRGKQMTYALLEERAPLARILTRVEALTALAGRYFRTRGPATIYDFSKWSGLTVGDARRGLEEVKSEFESQTIDGREYWFSPPPAARKVDAGGAYLLSIYDEFNSSYKDYSPIADAETRRRLMGMGNALLYIIVINGRVAGTYRRVLHRAMVEIEATYFRKLSEVEIRAVTDAARKFGQFVELPVEIVSRVV